MTVAANYDYAITQLHPLSLIDYFILNSYIVSMDWLNWNTAWWRGRHPDGGAKDGDTHYGIAMLLLATI